MILGWVTSTVSGSPNTEHFASLKTNRERMQEFDLYNIRSKKVTKEEYYQYLEIIKSKKDIKAEFYWNFQVSNLTGIYDFTEDEVEKCDERLEEIANKNNLKAEQVVVKFRKAIKGYARNLISEQQVYYYYLSCYEDIKSMGIKPFEFYWIESTLYDIGRNFYELGDRRRALECLLKAESLARKSSQFYILMLNLLENIYQDMNQPEMAFNYAQKIYRLCDTLRSYTDGEVWVHNYWCALSALNMAEYLYDQGKYPLSKKYLDTGQMRLKVTDNFQDQIKVNAEFDALQTLTKMNIRYKEYDEAWSHIKRSEFLMNELGSNMQSNYFKPLSLYKNMVNLFEIKGDFANAFHYDKLADKLIDSLNRRNDKRQIWQAEMQVQVEQHKKEMVQAELEGRSARQLNIVVVLILIFVLTGSLIIYYRIRNDNRIISTQKSLLEQSLSEKDILLKELHHRIKNNLQIISGLLEKQASKTTDEHSRQLLREGQSRVFSMALVHQSLHQGGNINAIQIDSYIQLLVDNILKSYESDDRNIEIITLVDKTNISIEQAIPLGLIINELITNCFKHAFNNRNDGIIKVIYKKTNSGIYLRVEDNGTGINNTSSSKDQGGLGMSLIRGLSRQLGAKLNEIHLSAGSAFEVVSG